MIGGQLERLRQQLRTIRDYRALVDSLNEVIGLQAEQIDTLRAAVADEKRLSRDIARFVADLDQEAFDEELATVRRIAQKLSDRVALAEEHDLA